MRHQYCQIDTRRENQTARITENSLLSTQGNVPNDYLILNYTYPNVWQLGKMEIKGKRGRKQLLCALYAMVGQKDKVEIKYYCTGKNAVL